MNIFYLDSNPQKCAEYHCDKHVVKMILESAQLLSITLVSSDLNGLKNSFKIPLNCFSVNIIFISINIYHPPPTSHSLVSSPSSLYSINPHQSSSSEYRTFPNLRPKEFMSVIIGFEPYRLGLFPSYSTQPTE